MIGLGLVSAVAFAEPKDDDNINRDEAKNRKIVVFQAGTDEGTKKNAVESRGGKVNKHLGSINATAASFANDNDARAMQAAPGVVRVEDDLIVEAMVVKDADYNETDAKGKSSGSPAPSQPAQTTPWGITRVKAPDAWAASQGIGVNVCVIDTGIDLSHPDLQENIKGGYNAINPAKSANDDNGHGTHVAGTIASVNNTIGVVGVAPKVNLLAVKVLGRNGSGWISDIIEGIDWCVKNGGKAGNMSLGSSSDSQSLHDAVIAAYNAGLTLVAAAGNSGPCNNCVGYPARYGEVIAVSAGDSTDQFAGFSSQGPEVDVIAPGKSVFSTYKGGNYATLSGTSMATPHVSGAVALKLAMNPALTPAAVADALKTNADPLPGLTTDQQGSGMVNAQKLVLTP